MNDAPSKSQPLAKTVHEEAVEKLTEIEVKLLATSFEKGSAYTNLVVAAGYATFFGLWTLTKSYLPKTAALWAALLMLASATTFVVFEVYKMYTSGSTIQSRYDKLRQRIAGKPLSEVLAEYQEADLDAKKTALTFIPLWRICLGVTVATALSAVAILASVYVIAIFNGAA